MIRQRILFVMCGFVLLFSKMSADSDAPLFNPTPIHEAFVARYSEDYAPHAIQSAPPAPIVEQAPARPSSDAVWIPGYWAWVVEKSDFSWVCGVWRRPPPDKIWISGYWAQVPDGWIWAKGFWSAVPQERLEYIAKTPPYSVSEKATASPGKNYFWISGYWNYSSSTKNYTWLSGTWNQFNKDWILTPAAYVWRPSGFVFVPLYWDWPLEMRGNAYACRELPQAADVSTSFSTTSYTIIEPEVIIQQLFFYYPDYINLYSNWFFFNPGWWDGCWCLPPWWFWADWWTFAWDDLWNLWWWWGELDGLPPIWLEIIIAEELEAPQEQMVEFMKRYPKPNFPSQQGTRPFRPTGPAHHAPIPRPDTHDNVTPGGTVTPPNVPSTTAPTNPTPTPPQVVTPPVPPPPPATQIFVAPTYPQSEPSYPQTPQYTPPPTYTTPPNYVPPVQPNYNPPVYVRPDYFPPANRQPNYNPPSRTTPPSYNPPVYVQPDYFPPANRQPNYNPPSRTTPPSYNPPSRTTPPSYNPPSRTQPNYNPPSRTQPGHTNNPSKGSYPGTQGRQTPTKGN